MVNLLDLRVKKVLRMTLMFNVYSWIIVGNICSYKDYCNDKGDVDYI